MNVTAACGAADTLPAPSRQDGAPDQTARTTPEPVDAIGAPALCVTIQAVLSRCASCLTTGIVMDPRVRTRRCGENSVLDSLGRLRGHRWAGSSHSCRRREQGSGSGRPPRGNVEAFGRSNRISLAERLARRSPSGTHRSNERPDPRRRCQQTRIGVSSSGSPPSRRDRRFSSS